MPVIMGRKTWESLGKPLLGRANIVISRQNDCKCEGADVVHNLFDAIEKARELHTKEVFVIGGGQIYKESLVVARRMYITRVAWQVLLMPTHFLKVFTGMNGTK